MSNYFPTIGLEIHAELKTKTKMFCGCLNDPQEKRPNVNICPVCMAHPGTLPVINKEAVHKVLLVGAALGGALPERAWFDRKNYFYPDIPKGYQISQYQDPLVSGGSLALPAGAGAKAGGVAITRVHLEEDTARSQHENEKSLVDFNRAGVPLMELVTEPVIHDAETAGRFARELQLLLRYLGASEANMEQGQMRVEANISVSNQQQTTNNKQLGTKVEVKNLNSFRSVERAIAHEIERQIALIESGGKVAQETRGWDENKQATFSQRLKESSHDYRYFPEPDLPQLQLSEIPEFSIERLRSDLPELPNATRNRYRNLGIKSEDIEMYISMRLIGKFFEEVSDVLNDKELARVASNYITSDIVGLLKSKYGESYDKHLLETGFTPRRISQIVEMLHAGEISSRGAKELLLILLPRTTTNGDVRKIALDGNLLQQSDAGALEAIAQKVIDANKAVAGEYRAGKTASLQFLIGQGMKESRGSANPQELRKIFERLLTNT